MKSRVMVFAAALILYSTSFAVSPEKLRANFEWGEYQQLIDTLEPFFAAVHPDLDSSEYARFHCYLAVAYFGKGRVGDARKQFLTALSFDSTVRLDRMYLSEEIDDLFTATFTEFIESKKRSRVNDSLLVLRQKVFDANLVAIKQEDLRKSKRTGILVAALLFTVGTAVAGVAGYEYYATKAPYNEFRVAAVQGDKSTYDRLRPTIGRANGIIISCAVAAVLSEAGGIVVTLRTFRLRGRE
jgi:tetratricopeptide (TPR) repeat protein